MTTTDTTLLVFRNPRYDQVRRVPVSRRGFLRFVRDAGLLVGFVFLGLTQWAKRAGAYTEYGTGNASACQGYDPDSLYDPPGPVTQNGWNNHVSCVDGSCVGGTHAGERGSWYSVTCAEQTGSGCFQSTGTNPFQWHYSGSRGAIVMGDRANVCLGGQGARDAWRWKINQGCGFCTTSTWRCHDGWKIDANGVFHSLTIAQGLVYCGANCYAC